MLGKIKSFSPRRGFGFITSEEGKDYFFHYSQLQMDGFKTIRRNTNVEFTPEKGERGDLATKIAALPEQ